jgi:hypothetical protein
VRFAFFVLVWMGCPKPLPAGPDTDSDVSDSDDGPNTPEIDVVPLALSLGPVGQDCVASGEVTVSNGGSYPLDVDIIEVVDDESTSFSVLEGAVQVLAPGDSAIVEVSFSPIGEGPHAASLRIHSDDRDEWDVFVALDGAVSENPVKTEDFEQTDAGPLDVVLVLDRDADEWLDGLIGEIGTLTAAFSALELDFQVAVLNMDMADAPGQFVGPVPIITAATPNPGQQLVDNIEASEVNSDQRAFDVVREALEVVNPTFSRADARLAVVAYSSSDDRSQESAAAFSTWLESVKADPSDVSYHGAVGAQLLPCFSGLKVADPAPTHIDAISQTGGEHLKICDFTSAELVNQLAILVSGLQAVFPLEDPVMDTDLVVVEVDGVPVLEDALSGWTYDATSVSVVFHGAAIPAAGAQISVTYSYPTPC